MVKKLIERFALYLLRKVGRNPVEVGIGKKVWFSGTWWLVTHWSLTHDGHFNRRKLNFTAIRHGEDEMP